MNHFVFYVWDGEGFWGSVRQSAASLLEAYRLVCGQLRETEVEPSGSLGEWFYLKYRRGE